ncbi:hypothetical protein EDF53_0988 [Curtobacterium sp. PhB78]|nr:hypothetical protein EDF53_0988 [Curtobacterium sp. PhB78]
MFGSDDEAAPTGSSSPHNRPSVRFHAFAAAASSAGAVLLRSVILDSTGSPGRR